MSARRRTAQGKRRTLASGPHGAPAGLLDLDHPVWHDDALYAAFCELMGWSPDDLPVTERMGVAAHPVNRRNCASVAWARNNQELGHVDWHRLRAMGSLVKPTPDSPEQGVQGEPVTTLGAWAMRNWDS